MSAYVDQPTRSPWLAQLGPDPVPRPLTGDAVTDVTVALPDPPADAEIGGVRFHFQPQENP